MFALSMLILATSLYFLGSFQETLTFRIEFPKVNGLAVDSPVHFNGVPIGRATRIVLGEAAEPGESVPIVVTIAVHRSAKDHIRLSTIADIKSIGVLGDKYILLLTPDYSAELLEEDGFIKPAANSLDVDKLLEQGTDFVSDAGQIMDNLKTLLSQLAEGDGVLQKLIKDKAMADQFGTTVTKMLAKIDSEDTLLSLLVNDPAFASHLKKDLLALTGSLNTLAEQLQSENGLVQALLNDPEYKAEVTGKITRILDQANAYIDRLTQAKGLLYTFTEDEAYAARVSQNIEKASAHLASILAKIDEGDGTAALLVNDPRLYAGLYEVVYGLENSGISKWYIQKKRKKGGKLLDRDAAEEKEDQP